MKRALLLVVPALLLAGGGTALATSADDVAAGLRTSAVYEEPGVDLVDEDVLDEELDGTDPQVYLAALSAKAATSDVQARARAVDIGRALGVSSAVVLVVTENEHVGVATGAGAVKQGVDGQEALQEARGDLDSFGKGDLTAFVTSFAQAVENQAGDASGGDGGGLGVLGPLLLVGAVGGGGAYLVARSRRRNRQEAKRQEGLRADVEQLYNRLGSDVSLLHAGDSKVAQQALADAAERYNATGAILATADTQGEFDAARRTAVEGLIAARTARTELGLDPGPEIPLPTSAGPQLEADSRVRFGEDEYDGSPSYRPGRGHYYEGGYVGGQMVPGGWYSAPFWTPFLLGSVLSGGFGGGGLFGGGGFERGYEAGQEDSHDGGSDFGGDGGDFGGGDFGGGGDSGGGGGDW